MVAIVGLSVVLVNTTNRVAALERQLAPAARPNAPDTARLGANPIDADRAEADYQRSKQLAADVLYSACRSQGGSRASCAKGSSR